MDNSIVATAILDTSGRFLRVNRAMCEFFGYDAATLATKTWQELTAPEDLEAGLEATRDLIAGRRDSYRIRKRYLHADGRRIWGDLSVSFIPRRDGTALYGIVQIIDITAEAESRERLAELADRLAAELASAARYVSSTLPRDLDGPVRVTSRYLPAQEVGGDCFDYRWIDDDHLMVYLIDVSGHGAGHAGGVGAQHAAIRVVQR